MALVQRASCGKLVSPAKNTSTETINKPRAKPNNAPTPRLSQFKPIFLINVESAIVSKLAISKTPKKVII